MSNTLITVVRVDLPPEGELETSGDGSNPTEEQMREEQELRDKFVDSLGVPFDAVLARPPHRSGNVSGIDLLGTNVWSTLNHYLLFLEVDIGDPRVDIGALVPRGSSVEVIGQYRSIRRWPEDGDAAR